MAQPLQILGGAYSDDARPWSDQDTCNYILFPAEKPGTRTEGKLIDAPGLYPFANVGTGPHRGARDVEGKCFVVSGTKLYQVSVTGVTTEIGTIPGTGRVSMTHNQIADGNEVVIGTLDNSYVYNTTTGVLAATGVALFSVDFLNQRILGVDPERRFWRYSGLANAMSWNTLDNESAESSPDRIVGGIVSQGEWLVFGERTIEVWNNSPTTGTAFQRSVVIERGCANGDTLARLDNSVFFLGNDNIVYRLDGYSPRPISTSTLTKIFSDCDPAKAFAFTYEDRGRVIYYLTHSDGRTFGYDVTTQEWHRRESYGLNRWRLATLFKWDKAWYGGDFADGTLYRLNWRHMKEGCDELVRYRRSGVLHGNQSRVTVNSVEWILDPGRLPGADLPAPTITGNLPDGYVGDTVSYQYTINASYPGQAVTASIASGALPAGLSLSASGLVTGTRTTVATATWTVRVTTDCGTTADVADSSITSDVTFYAVTASLNNATYGRSVGGTDWSPALQEAAPVTVFGATDVVTNGSGTVIVLTTAAGRTSSNAGQAWADTTGGGTQTNNCAIYSSGAYLIAANASRIKRSTDAVAFTEIIAPDVPGYSTDNLLAISATSSLVVACGYWPHTSTDNGATWLSPTATFVFTGSDPVQALANDGTKFIAVGTNNLMASTTDGVTWTAITSPFAGTGTITAIARHAGVWVIGNAAGQFAYSATGATGSWTVSGSTLGAQVNKIVGRAGLFVAVGQSGKIASSPTGETWTARANNFGTNHVSDIAV